MDTRFLQQVALVLGSFNPSKPFADGTPSKTMGFGTVHINLADPRIQAALAAGKTSVAVDTTIRQFERKDGSGSFWKIEGFSIYEKEEQAATG